MRDSRKLIKAIDHKNYLLVQLQESYKAQRDAECALMDLGPGAIECMTNLNNAIECMINLNNANSEVRCLERELVAVLTLICK